jgi:membrane-associated phospholipid phosphatase
LPRPPSTTLPLAAFVLALAAAASVAFIDEPLARAIDAHGRGLEPAWLAATAAFDALSGIDLWRYFAGALFVAAGVVATVSPRLRPYAASLWFVAVAHLAIRVTVTPLKSIFGRLRPYQWLDAGQPAHTFFAGGIGFPSGHVIYYLSLGLPLAIAFPRARVAFVAIPAFLGLTRIGASQHFLGDTLAAAVWVTFVTWLVRLVFERRVRGVPDAQRP